jgi:hypothetical protein
MGKPYSPGICCRLQICQHRKMARSGDPAENVDNAMKRRSTLIFST